MIYIVGSIVLAMLNLSVTWMMTRKMRKAWVWYLAAQIPNTAYDILTRQYGFLAISCVSVFLGVSGYRHWRTEEIVD